MKFPKTPESRNGELTASSRIHAAGIQRKGAKWKWHNPNTSIQKTSNLCALAPLRLCVKSLLYCPMASVCVTEHGTRFHNRNLLITRQLQHFNISALPFPS
jgi:hypothetical protein